MKRRKLLYAEPPLKQTESYIPTQTAVAVRPKAAVVLNKHVTETPSEPSSKGGISLIDVVVTIAIMTALLAGGSIGITGMISNAHDLEAKSQLANVATAEMVTCGSGEDSCFVPVEKLPAYQPGVLENSDADGYGNVSVQLHANSEKPGEMDGFTATVKSESGKVFRVTNENRKPIEVKQAEFRR